MDKVDPKAKDFYKRLGLDRDASYDQIRKIYRRCVMKFHPDRNPNDPEAEEKMKLINEAYEVLSDSEKREVYNRYGEDGLKGGGAGGAGGFPFGGGGIFDHFFGGGGGGGFGGFGGEPAKNKPKKTPTITRKLQCTLEDVYCGKVRRIRVTRKRLCPQCKGTGSTKKGGSKTCSECDGRGKVVRVQTLGPGFVSKSVTVCPKCKGEGTMIDPRYRCKKCTGEGTVEEKKTLEVHIDKGMKTGQKIEFEGEADEKPGYKAGDIVFILQVSAHHVFKRDGLNLEMKKKINLSEALTGLEFLVTHLDGRKLHVKSKPGQVISPGMIRQITGEGMPRFKFPYEKGNLLIRFEIEFPKKIPKTIQQKLIEMLPEKESVEEKKDYEVNFLEPPQKVTSGGRRREAYDSSDEEEEEGERGQTIACNIQ